MREADEADLSGLTDRVLARCEEAPPLPLTDRLSAWMKEVFTYRKPLLIPSMALATAALLTLTLPGVIDRGPGASPGIDGLRPRYADNRGVEVRILSTGTELAMVYQLPTTNTTVIWISDRSDSTEE